MLFNSYLFILLFLPITLLGYFRLATPHRVPFLIVVSLVFYGYWNLEHLLLLTLSIVLNYAFAHYFSERYTKVHLSGIVLFNLIPLLIYKYSTLFIAYESSLVLPLAISFFSFQQIAFQVDLYRKREKLGSFRDYLFFILFFPQLVAGPIVHYHQLIPQIKSTLWGVYHAPYFHMGILLFAIGLFKKVVLADTLAPIADDAFEHTATINNHEAWLGLLAYSFQIYFDFSGYSDMAIGLALLFGIKLPINFDSPYKAKNLVEFWRRWHITLSTFLKDHVYVPLGGNRKGISTQAMALLLTMVLGGIWHGAGWMFLLWGLLHGLFLILVHTLTNVSFFTFSLPKPLGILLTFTTVTLLWVLFRAESLTEALHYYQVLFDFTALSFVFGVEEMLVIAAGFIVWLAPNSLWISHYRAKAPQFYWYHALYAAFLLFVALKALAMAPAQNFVYFNF